MTIDPRRRAHHRSVVWASDPVEPDTGHPRPWLVLSGDRMPCSDEEPIAVAFRTRSHHPGSFAVPSDAWIRDEPGQQSYVLPWTVATLKDDLHVVGTQGSVTDDFTEQVTRATISYMGRSDAPETTWSKITPDRNVSIGS